MLFFLFDGIIIKTKIEVSEVIMIGNSWDEKLQIIENSAGIKKFLDLINHEYATKTIYPPKNYIFESLKRTPYENVKAVIVGQDPYHGENEAHGLSFSVQKGVKIPPSLKNIYTEIFNDIGCEMSNNGCLLPWARQGVLLLNSVLSVRAGCPGSHKNLGWQWFTDEVIKKLSSRNKPIVFLLWGNFAISKKDLIDTSKHVVLTAAHPSPYSAHNGFFGCKHFSKTNSFLLKWGSAPINWQI